MGPENVKVPRREADMKGFKGGRGWAAGLLCLAVLSACGRGRERAALALDEARLAVASALDAGAATQTVQSAIQKLEKAEADFKGGRFVEAEEAARWAVSLAQEAKAGAEKKTSDAKKMIIETPPERAGGKPKRDR